MRYLVIIPALAFVGTLAAATTVTAAHADSKPPAMSICHPGGCWVPDHGMRNLKTDP